mgnify:CR=1 FL=1
MVKAIAYRTGQFLRALTARVSREEVTEALRLLTPEARALFHCQSIPDRRHGLAVYRMLLRAGYTNQHLLTAALLHDVGKAAAGLSVWHRVIIVLLRRFAPRLWACLSKGEPQGWRRPFIIHARHAEIGAQWAQEAGCSPLTVALIRRHQDLLTECQTEEDRLLAALQAADNAD